MTVPRCNWLYRRSDKHSRTRFRLGGLLDVLELMELATSYYLMMQLATWAVVGTGDAENNRIDSTMTDVVDQQWVRTCLPNCGGDTIYEFGTVGVMVG